MHGCGGTLPAVVGAGVVLAALEHALVAPFLADVEGDGERVFRNIWRAAVGADAVPVKRILDSSASTILQCRPGVAVTMGIDIRHCNRWLQWQPCRSAASTAEGM